MTRFARAKGSKSSNERVPEEATSWTAMKRQMEEQKQEVEHDKKRKEFEAVRNAKYAEFLQENDVSKGSEWADIPGSKTSEKPTKSKANGKQVKVGKVNGEPNGKNKTKVEISENQTENSNGIEDMQVRDVKDKIDEDGHDSDDAPVEVSAKVAPAKISVKKSKKNRIKLKIEAVNEKPVTNEKIKKPVEELTEEELQKLNKKKERRRNQAEKRKKFKAEQKAKEPEKPVVKETFRDNTAKPSEASQKRKLPKPRDDKEHKKRKPQQSKTTMNINGVEVSISYLDGFPIKTEDAARLYSLRKQMISKGIPRSQVQAVMKLERRKAEKALGREKKSVCFNCRKSGHVLAECPSMNENSMQETAGTGICFKCGSTEHTHFECRVVRSDDFKFATCFICREQGHISRQCPDNQKGMYPKGGACKVCGDVTHLKKDCPKYQEQQESSAITLDTLKNDNVESLGDEGNATKNKKSKSNKIVKF